MTSQNVHRSASSKLMIDQIGRLEQGLLTLRETAVGSPEVLDMIALIQYQEVLRLRSELDAGLGFDRASDLVMSLHGPFIEPGIASSSIVASMLNNIRGAMQSIVTYLVTGQRTRSGRFPEWVHRATDFRFAGLAAGSVRIGLNLPEPHSMFPEEEREPVERGIQLILNTIDWLSSDAHLDAFQRNIQDEHLARLLLTQVRRVAPTRNSIVQRVEFSGRLADSNERLFLSPLSAARIRDALHQASSGTRIVSEEGKLRSVDVDQGIFTLRQRPDGKPDLTCEISDEILLQALNYLVRDVLVIVEGAQEFSELGRPTRLIVDDIRSASGIHEGILG